ncbi:MAG: GntR family transcriptional regulator [Rubellimicrobium sp.]|nr:GntR family transcriptional regulator [Rubellimicrobium sp.]
MSEHQSEQNRRIRGAVTVSDTLREDILSMRMAPGSAIDEVALAARFGLSRTPVREALVALEGERLVTFLQNRTTIVTPHSMENANDYLDLLTLLSRAVFRQAAERRQDEDLAELRALSADLGRAVAVGEIDGIEQADLALKRRICTATTNFFFQRHYPSCLDSGRRTMRLHYYPFATRTELEGAAASFQSLLDAIEARDMAECDAIATWMIADVVMVLQRSIQPGDAALMPIETAAVTRLEGLG